jgi:hypothetical protein
MDLEKMTTQELLRLKNERYQASQDNGTIGKLHLIAEELGENFLATYGPKYCWDKDNVRIYVDDYGHYMTVNFNNRLVCSTHPCQQFIILGEWIDIALASYQEAFDKERKKRLNFEKLEREEILRKLI